MRTIFFIAICFATIVTAAYAQNNVSPYSSIGVGDIEKGYFDRSSGLGGAGLALSGGRFLYNSNPAAYSFLDDRYFHLETSARYKNINYSGKAIITTSNNQSADLQIKKLTAAIKLKPYWGFSVGLLPFSNSNYSFYSLKTVQGSGSFVDAYNEGTGNLSQFYIANSFKLRKNLSIGLQVNYFFGQLQRTETLYNTITDSGLVTINTQTLNNPQFKLGIQYKPLINKNLRLSIGATGSLQTKLRSTEMLNIKYGGSTLYNNDTYSTGYYTLPVMAGAGIAAIYKEKITITADYHFQNWSDISKSGLSYRLVNSNKIAGGIEYSKKLEFTDNYTNQKIKFERIFYQLGCFYSNSYLQVYGKQLTDYGITMGIGLNSMRNTMGIIAGLELGTRGTTTGSLIKENYTQFNVTLCYRDIWFTSKKRYN